VALRIPVLAVASLTYPTAETYRRATLYGWDAATTLKFWLRNYLPFDWAYLFDERYSPGMPPVGLGCLAVPWLMKKMPFTRGV